MTKYKAVVIGGTGIDYRDFGESSSAAYEFEEQMKKDIRVRTLIIGGTDDNVKITVFYRIDHFGNVIA